jgi:pyruvate/2-oxoglutarate dehydrogenase complex dihydrolipoamide dehydrogenase (E3) component
MNKKAYDLVVIGGGPAGIAGAATAAGFGKSVALIDGHHELGGAGVNTGTAPSKTLRETALALSGARSRNLYGVDLSLRKEATVADFLRHERNVKIGLNRFVKEMLEHSKIDVHYGTAIFEDDHTVIIRSAKDGPEIHLRGEMILIATGSSPVRPVIFPFDSPCVYGFGHHSGVGPPAKDTSCCWRRCDWKRIRINVFRARYASSVDRRPQCAPAVSRLRNLSVSGGGYGT